MSESSNKNSGRPGDFWGTEKPLDHSKALSPSDEPGTVWKSSTPSPPSSAPNRKRRWLLWTLGGGAGVIALLVAAAPTLAGILAPSLGPGFVPVNGKVTIESASFGWFSGQSLGTTTIFDDQGKEVARFKASTSAGLFSLLIGGRNLGAIKVEGKADLVRAPDGTTNLQRVLKPSTAPPPPTTNKPSTLPEGLALTLEGTFDVTYTDQANPARSAKLRNLAITADLAAGKPLKATIKGKAEPTSGAPGEVNVALTLDDWSDSSGVIQIDSNKPLESTKPKIDLTASITNLPSSLIDAFSTGPSLREALGDTFTVSTEIKGRLRDAAALFTFDSARAKATANLGVRDGVVTLTQPARVNVSGQTLAALIPAAANLTTPGRGAASLAALPDVTITIENLSATLPKGSPLDLRGASAMVTVGTTAVKGTLAAAGQPLKPFEIDALTASFRTEDLAKGTTLKASTRATIDGQPAGVIGVDLATGSLLDGQGAPIAGIPQGLVGGVTITGIATEIAQPFLGSLPIDLPADVGPTLDLALVAKASDTKGAGGTGQIPPTDFDVTIKARDVEGLGRFTASAAAIATRGDGFTLRARSASRLAQKFLGRNPAYILGPTGVVNATLRGLNVPLSTDRKPQLAKAGCLVEITAEGWSVAPSSGNVGPVDVRSFAASVILAADQPAKLSARGSMSHQSSPFALLADVSAPGLLTNDAAKPVNMDALLSTLAKVEITAIPASLVALMPTKPTAEGTSPTPTPQDLAFAVEQVVGATVDLKVTTTQSAKGLDLVATIGARNVSASVAGNMTPTAVSLTTIKGEARLDPVQTRAALVRLRGEAGIEGLPELAEPTAMTLEVEPITIPMKQPEPGSPGLTPDLGAARGDLSATFGSARVLVRVPTKPGQPAIGTVGLRDVGAKSTLPLQVALGAPAVRGTLDASLSAGAVRVPTSGAVDVGRVTATVRGEVAERKVAGPVHIAAVVKDLAAAFLDELAGKPGVVTGALGDSVALDAKATLTPDDAGNLAAATGTAEIDLRSPKMATTSPIKLNMLADRIVLAAPSGLSWTVEPAFLAALTPQTPGGEPASLRLAAPTTATLALTRVALSKQAPGGPEVGPLLPGIFDLAASVTAPGLTLVAKDGTSTRLGGVSFTTERDAKGIAFNVGLGEAQAGNAPAVSNIKLPGRIDDLADASGNVNATTAKLTAVGDLPAMPTIVLDTLAAKDGLLVEALGPVTTIKIDADRFGRSGGRLSATATSARASFDLAGTVEDGLFVNTPSQPLRVGVMEITQALSGRVVKGLPLFGKVEKSSKDRPAMITGTGLRVPLSSDLSKFDGDFVIDPGEVSFEIAGDFADIVAGPLLSAVKANAAGKAGQKLSPLTVNVKGGIARVQRWSVPVGEFPVSMEGTMNLATGEVDFVTYFPAGALALEKLKLPGGALGSIAGDVIKNAVIPVRTRGGAGGTARKTEVDSDAAAKELIKGVDPGKLIERGLQDLLKPKK
jgi:hypothetical protein